MITKILPIALLVFIFYVGSIYSSRDLSKKLEKKSQIFHDPVIDNYLKSFQSILELHNLKVFVLNEKQINGLVTPNGNIYITQGFINQYKLGKVSGVELTMAGFKVNFVRNYAQGCRVIIRSSAT